MRVLSLLLFLAVPATISACEGDCIVGITNAWLSNYSSPIHTVIDSLAHQISDLIPSHPPPSTTLSYLSPIVSAYHDAAYRGMEAAIFPHYFHGKCLDSSGQEPAGCPNPDCPIVCGTPGSLVHFFPKLRYIAFNQTYHLLQALATPGSPTYAAVERSVLDASSQGAPIPQGERRRSLGPNRVLSARFTGRGLPLGNGLPLVGGLTGSSALGSAAGLDLIAEVEGVLQHKRSPDVKDGLRSIMEQVHALLQEACGGDGTDVTNGLPHCSWEGAMKDYILTFP